MQIASRIGTKFDAWLEHLGYLNKADWHNPASPFSIDRKGFLSDVAKGIFCLCVLGAIAYGVVRLFTAEPPVTRAEVQQIVSATINQRADPHKAGQ